MAEKFWTKERQAEAERLGDAFWTPENTKLYKQAMNFTTGSLTGHIPHPEVLDKIRWRDVRAGDVIYYRNRNYGRSNVSTNVSWSKRKIIEVKRLSHRNLIEITYSNRESTTEHKMKCHAKKFTRLLARDSD